MDTFLVSTLLVVFLAAISGGFVAKKAGAPVMLGYIAGGLIFGNILSRFIQAHFLQSIADIGVTLLLFTLGVEFSLHRIGKVVHAILPVASLQLILSFLVFFFLFLFIHFPFAAALFLAIAASLSSTTIVVKILSERGELETIPGEILVGWLIIQDLTVIPIMIILPALLALGTTTTIAGLLGTAGLGLGKALLFIFFVFFIGKGIKPALRLVTSVKSRELFLVSTVAIVFLAAIGSVVFGLSPALGAFIAGLLISETSEHHAVFAEIRPLRDVFAVIFFVTIGMTIPFSFLLGNIGMLILLVLLIIFVKWLVSASLMRVLHYHRKTSFLVALGLLPMSEFGFIIAQTGVSLHAINTDQYVFLVGLTFFTMLLSPPFIAQGQKLYYWWQARIGKAIPLFFDEKTDPQFDAHVAAFDDHVVICGYGRVGKYIGRALTMSGIPFLVIDYNHATVAAVRAEGISVIFGDPAERSILDRAHVASARALIVAIPDKHTQEMVIAGAQTINKRIRIICRTHHEEDQSRLKSLGVQTIIQPEFEAALSIVERLLPDFGVSKEDVPGKIARLKIEHGAV